jgi:hypothetical protein
MIRLIWAGGEHDFALRIEQLRALQTRCDAGPGFILNRLASGQWRIDDPIEVIRLGLMGGGIERKEADRLVKLHVEEKPLTASVILAYGILSASLNGEPDDAAGEPLAGETMKNRESGENGGSPAFTD